jgi:hypothetical protein
MVVDHPPAQDDFYLTCRCGHFLVLTDDMADVIAEEDWLAAALANDHWLRVIELRHANSVATSAWRAFAPVLRSPQSALEKLELTVNILNDHVVVSLANALTQNNKLKELLVCGLRTDITAEGHAALARILCNNASIFNTYLSNHTLQKVDFCVLFRSYAGYGRASLSLPPHLRSLLQLNRENDESQTAWLKIIMTHFCGVNIDVQPFIDMELNVLPLAIAWIGRYGRGNDILFTLVRHVPFIFDLEDIRLDTQTTTQEYFPSVESCRDHVLT